MIVDAHLHVFQRRSARYPRDVHELYPADRSAPVELLLDVMAAHSVQRAVLVPLAGEDAYVTQCVAADPARFAGVLVADPGRPGDAERVRRRLAHPGLQGLRMFSLGDPAVPDVEALSTFPVLSALAQDGHLLWFYAPAAHLAWLPAVLDALPGLRVVLNHLGFTPASITADEHRRPHVEAELPPPTLPAVLALAARPQVHVMVSGQYAFSSLPYPHDDVVPIVRALYEAFGADRLLWASDFPWILDEPGYGAQLALVDLTLPGLTPAERAAVLGGTASRLFTFAGAGP